MATITVTNLYDSGPGSLRQALLDAASGTTITFAPGLAGGTLALTSGELDITQNVTINGDLDGNGTPDITIDGRAASRVFEEGGSPAIFATLDGLVITNGWAASGGGIATGDADNLFLKNSKVIDNHVSGSGGGIYGGPGGEVVLINTTVSGNTSDGTGGGIYANSVLTTINATISGNYSTTDGGGIGLGVAGGGSFTNTTLVGNESRENGGGIYGHGASQIRFYDSTLTGNYAGAVGGGIYNGGSTFPLTLLSNSIDAGNAAAVSAPDLALDGSPLFLHGNNILGSAPANASQINKDSGTYTQIDGTSVAALAGVFARIGPNPRTLVLSGVLADNGGPVRTVAITPDGMAYNTGSNAALPSDSLDVNGNSNTSEPLPVDARGFDRVVGGTVDIGAFEQQQGTVFEVTTLADESYDGGTLAQETADGTGLSLREALGLANQDPTTFDTIEFDPKLIGGSTHGVDDGVLLLTNGELTINGNVEIDGDINSDGTPDITIDGQGASRDLRIIGGQVTLNGLTITGGNGYSYGGGVSLQTGSYAPAHVVISRSIITNNQAAYGGGVSVDPADFLLLTNSAVSGNQAFYVGGGIASQGGLEMLGTTVSGNSAGYIGGGIANDNILVVINSTLSNNQITNTSRSLRFGNGGGGLYNSGVAALVNTTVAGNDGSYAGGGIYNSGGLLLTNATVANNSAYNGGGLYNAACGCGNGSIYDSTFTGNFADQLGGGIDNANGAVFLTNTIVAGNGTGYNGADVENGIGTTYYAGVNLFSQGGIGRPGTDIYQPDLTRVFADLTTIDPDGLPNSGDEFLAGTLANNGGAVQTVAIAIGGNAQNMGATGYLPTNTFNLDNSGYFGEPLPVDARGAPRVSGPAVDIGAVEAQPILALVPTNVGYTEQAPPVELSPPFGNPGALTVTEAGASPTQAVVAAAAVTVATGAVAGDMLAADTAGTNITASYDSATETLTLTGTDTLADYSQVLDSVTFSSPSDNPDDFGSDPTRFLTWSVTDIAGASSVPGTTTIDVTTINNPPTLSNVAAQALVLYTGQTITLSPAVTVSDPDSLTFAGATVAITGGAFPGDGDMLAGDTAGTSITASYDAATETLTLSGTDTLAHYQSVLDSVTFDSTSPNPTNTNADATRTVTWTLDDGSASNNLSTAATSTIFFRNWVKNDFNADRKSDLLLQNAPAAGTPDVMIDFLTGTTVTSSATTFGVPSGLSVEAAADFNHDGTSDLLLQHSDGLPEIWLMNDGRMTSVIKLPNTGSSWHIIAATDFNGDGNADILWQNNDGLPAIWLMGDTTPRGGGALPVNPGASWRAIGAGDFNGDGKADILWQNADGQPVIWFMNGVVPIGGGALPLNPGASWHAIGVGDFNGDGKADILWQNADGQPDIWFMNGTNVIGGGALPLNPGASWHAIGTSDFNGDGLADIVWQNTDGTPDIWEMNGTRILGGGPIANPGATWQVKADGPIPPDQMTSQLPAVHLSLPDTTSLTSPLSTPDGIGSSGSGATQQTLTRQLFAGAG